MKIIKTASGKKIKISKSEWQSIGKKAGWMKKADGWGKYDLGYESSPNSVDPHFDYEEYHEKPNLDWPAGTTKEDAMEQLEPYLKEMLPGYRTYDAALPLGWVNDVREKVGGEVAPHFVWVYEQGAVGRPYPITNKGKDILSKYNEAAGTAYSV